jgi:two-component system, LuxR family, response regulator FixJ
MKNVPVYVVDDDQAMLSSAEFLLHSLDLSCRTFDDPYDFVRAVPSLPPGCVLSDMRMPSMGGLELQAALNAQSLDWPIIFMTGQCDAATRKEALRQGAIDIIEKPFHGDRLMAVLEKAFNAFEGKGLRAP